MKPKLNVTCVAIKAKPMSHDVWQYAHGNKFIYVANNTIATTWLLLQ
jgi:hypothetical protein